MAATKHKHKGVSPPRLTVTVDGPNVGKARLSAVDLAEIVKRTQQALKRVGRVLYGADSQRQGRDKADIEQLCELFLVAWEPGSAVAQLELGEPPAQIHMFGYIGQESVSTFVTGMAKIVDSRTSASALPTGFDRGVLQTCHAMARVLDHGIDTIRFAANNGKAGTSCTLDSVLRNRVQELLGQPVDVADTAKTGRVEELNGHGSLTGRLWEPDGTKWLCHFKEEHLEQLPDAWMRTACVMGRAIVEEGKERIFEVESLIVLGTEMETLSTTTATPFWKSLSLDELAEQQGVCPVSDLDDISNLWPADDDADDLLQHVLHERAVRRSLSGEDHAR